MLNVGVACAGLIVTVFATSSASKVHSRRAFADFRRSTRVMFTALVGARFATAAAAAVIAWAVVVAEMVTVSLVVFPATAAAGFGLACVVLVGLSMAMAATVRSRQAVSCRCFGASAVPVKSWHLWRNALLLAVAVGGLVAGAVKPDGSVTPTASVIAVAVGVVVAVLLIRFDDLVELLRPSRIGP
ncbi:MAG TPA: MauE/DoxX family redox-associated membrane protein [Micromonosporaceae bacterium]|nr:MauE/DoxX family redox-associated membrane protein [Micromonosporaceae bacterium]